MDPRTMSVQQLQETYFKINEELIFMQERAQNLSKDMQMVRALIQEKSKDISPTPSPNPVKEKK